MSGSLLGVDLGDRRVGLALADADTRLARPFRTVRRGATVADDVAVLRRICDEQRVTALVVGLPIEASGIEGPMAAAAREWAAAVGEALGLPVTLRDERLSSFVAERRVGPMPRGRSGGPPTRTQREAHRERIDREAAAVILQDELDATSPGSPSSIPQVSA